MEAPNGCLAEGALASLEARDGREVEACGSRDSLEPQSCLPPCAPKPTWIHRTAGAYSVVSANARNFREPLDAVIRLRRYWRRLGGGPPFMRA